MTMGCGVFGVRASAFAAACAPRSSPRFSRPDQSTPAPPALGADAGAAAELAGEVLEAIRKGVKPRSSAADKKIRQETDYFRNSGDRLSTKHVTGFAAELVGRRLSVLATRKWSRTCSEWSGP